MKIRMGSLVSLLVLIALVLFPLGGLDATMSETQAGHKKLSGVVIKKAGAQYVKTPDGTTYQLNEKQSKRHSHEPFKEGDEVTFVVNENNAIIDAHLKGEEGQHTFVTGKLIHVGKMKKEIKLQTSDGEKVYPLLLQETKTKALEEGASITVELNEAGTVIDLHRAEGGGKKK